MIAILINNDVSKLLSIVVFKGQPEVFWKKKIDQTGLESKGMLSRPEDVTP